MATTTTQVPAITEDDLLAFQFSHFGDDTKPEDWFVDPDTALQYDPTTAPEEDDLGWYPDGTKRTLTDEQIAIFRHSEIEHLLRERRLLREEEDYQNRNPDDEALEAPCSPASDVSSLEADLVGLAGPAPSKPSHNSASKRRANRKQRRKALPPQRQPSQSGRSDTSRSTDPARRPRREQVPYDQRHKRKWEDFIDEIDPVEGSLTHRRIVRQLDEHRGTELEIDYGEDAIYSQKLPTADPPPPGRRMVSYGDDP